MLARPTAGFGLRAIQGELINVTNDLPYRWVTRVAVDPFDENTAYVTFSGLKWKDPEPHVYKTTNKGVSWMSISTNLPDAPVNAIVIDPNRPEIIFVGTDVGAYYTINGGQSWQDAGPDLPLVSVYDMKIHDAENFLVAGTHGRSMYKLDLTQIIDIPDNRKISLKDFCLLPNYPNPFNPITTIKYELTGNHHVKLKIFNILGQEICMLVNSAQSAGQYKVLWNGRNQKGKEVSSGVYLYRLEVNGYAQTKKMMFVK